MVTVCPRGAVLDRVMGLGLGLGLGQDMKGSRFMKESRVHRCWSPPQGPCSQGLGLPVWKMGSADTL